MRVCHNVPGRFLVLCRYTTTGREGIQHSAEWALLPVGFGISHEETGTRIPILRIFDRSSFPIREMACLGKTRSPALPPKGVTEIFQHV